ncbi:MAG: class I SAM-dependent methyltransferase [Cyclobacteriaceae bacterium]
MYERLEECPVCKHPAYKNIMICKDHLVSEESFALVECDKCKLVYTNPRPTPENLSKYYQSADYISHTSKGNNLTNIAYKIARHFTKKQKYNLVSKSQSTGSILDYGCGTGDLLKFFQEKGWSVRGVEPNEQAANIARSENKLKVIKDLSKIGKEEKFDVIMLWHVMEHIADLRKTARKLVRLLKDNGTLIIAVPNHDSFDAEYYKEDWAAYDVPRHLYHFNQLNIKQLFKVMKVKQVDLLPMKLDAYYVALLSEKNQGKPNNYLKAIQIGRRSNQYATKNNNNFSSLIYVVKK